MQEFLNVILKIQELDIKMVRLMRMKKDRLKELEKVHSVKEEIQDKVKTKDIEIIETKKDIGLGELKIKEIEEKISKLESQQSAVKKMEEFNALTLEMSNTGKERRALEHKLSDLMDKLAAEEDAIVTLKEKLDASIITSVNAEKEISESIKNINDEGSELLSERTSFVSEVDPDFFKIYERLLKNKKDRVIVPIENRVCCGCHIVLTPQHENLVRRKDRIVFCEHCSRILYWKDSSETQKSGDTTPLRRRRRKVSI